MPGHSFYNCPPKGSSIRGAWAFYWRCNSNGRRGGGGILLEGAFYFSIFL
uniref:Uncharacterized protein n=1 Tax=Meloidogyne enterolobii TaxID=390850 RepID=A0A6V7UDN6_MELEN|nr:unnamed protein product [Meloidogyne enterolobii]